MTIENLVDRIAQAVQSSGNIVRVTLPRKTGNLQDNAYYIKKIDDYHYDIGINLEIAPYAQYINEPGYRTQGYWDKAVEDIIKLIAQDLGAKVEE